MKHSIKFAASAAIALSMMGAPVPAAAQTGDSNYLGEIAQFGFGFCPKNWAPAAGQQLNINTNAALFSLLGTTYGGDGIQFFNLPDLRGRMPIGQGQGPGLSPHTLGERSGTTTTTLLTTQMPLHAHQVLIRVSSAAGTKATPTRNTLAAATDPKFVTSAGSETMEATTVELRSAGGNQPFAKQPPYSTTNYCIALTGIFPSRN